MTRPFGAYASVITSKGEALWRLLFAPDSPQSYSIYIPEVHQICNSTICLSEWTSEGRGTGNAGNRRGIAEHKKGAPKTAGAQMDWQSNDQAECLFVDFIRPSLPVATFVF